MAEATEKETALATAQGGIPAVPGGGRAGAMATAFQGLIPTSIGEALALATYLAKSLAIPKFYRGKPETILTVILAGLEVGLTPIRSLNNLTNISGNLGMKADLQLALVRRSNLLDYYDEGFELKGRTDADLKDRAQDGAKVLALVRAVPDGKPYGWATARRKADPNYATRTFTWLDAETAEIWELDEDGNGKKKSKLSEKFNYVSFPADMYPKRARGRVLQVTHSDVLAGMLSVEAMEGGQIQVFDVDTEPADTLDDLLAAAGDERQAIEAGFDALELSQARRLQKLVEFKDRPAALTTWLRDEYGQRTGKGKAGTARKAKAGAAVLDAQIVESPAPGPGKASGSDQAAGRVPVSPPAPVPPVAVPATVETMKDEPGQADFLGDAMPTVPAEPDKPKSAETGLAEVIENISAAIHGTAPKPISTAAQAAAKFRERFGKGSPTF